MRTFLLITAALLTACARTEPADPTPGEDLEANAAPAVAAAPAEEQTRPGQWEASAQGGAQAVAFRSPEGQVLFSISCDERAGLVVQRPGLVARGNLAMLQLRTGDTVRRLAVTTGSGAANEPQVQATVPYNDQLISALMRFDQPLEIRYEGLETLILPASPVVGDLVRTCQRSAGPAATGAEPQQSAQPPQSNAAEASEQPQPRPQ